MRLLAIDLRMAADRNQPLRQQVNGAKSEVPGRLTVLTAPANEGPFTPESASTA